MPERDTLLAANEVYADSFSRLDRGRGCARASALCASRRSCPTRSSSAGGSTTYGTAGLAEVREVAKVA